MLYRIKRILQSVNKLIIISEIDRTTKEIAANQLAHANIYYFSELTNVFSVGSE